MRKYAISFHFQIFFKKIELEKIKIILTKRAMKSFDSEKIIVRENLKNGFKGKSLKPLNDKG